MDGEVGDHAQGARGSLRVFANNSAMVQYLPGDLSRFLAAHPLIHVSLDEAISPDIVRAVADGIADIGIYGGNVAAPGLTVLPYRQDRLVVVVPPATRCASRQPRGSGTCSRTTSWACRRAARSTRW